MIWLILTFLSVASQAENLKPFALAAPLDEGALTARCEAAFLEVLRDRETYERRPEINLMCAHNLNAKQMEVLRKGFVGHCENTARLRARGVAPGQSVEMDLRALKTAFDGEYAGIFRSICLDTAVNAFHVKEARQRGQTGAAALTTSGPCGYVNCQAPIATR